MGLEIGRSGALPAPDALRLEHDEMRAQLTCATMEDGPVGEAARRLALLSLPHFEQEEKYVFPAFDLLQRLAHEDAEPEMAEALPLISRFGTRREDLSYRHESILSAAGTLVSAARRQRNREVADLAYRVWLHERTEDAVIYPAVILIGKYVRERLGLGPESFGMRLLPGTNRPGGNGGKS
jgi:hypothetical protein